MTLRLAISFSARVLTALLQLFFKLLMIATFFIAIFAIVVFIALLAFRFLGLLPGSSVSINTANLLLTFVALVIAIVVAAIGVAGWFLSKKFGVFDKIEKQLENLNRTICIGAEVATAQIPNWLVAQHVPGVVVEIVEPIKRLVYDDPHIQETIDKIGNGAKLRFTIAMYHYGRREYTDCIKILKKVAYDMMNVSSPLREVILWRLGIAYRQCQDYEESIRVFRELESS